MSLKVLYSVEEAAGILSISRAHVYRLMDRGELGSVIIGRSRRISMSQIEQFVAKLEAESSVPPLHDWLRIRRKTKTPGALKDGQESR